MSLRSFARSLRPVTLLAAAALAIVLVAILLAAVVRANAPAPNAADMLVGRPLLQVSLPTEEGGQLDGTRPLLPRDGHAALVLFIYSLCSRCSGDAAAAYAIAQQHGLDLVVVDSPAETPAITDAYAMRLGLSGPILLDHSAALAARLGIGAYPALLLTDARGIVRRAWIGETSPQTINAGIAGLTP